MWSIKIKLSINTDQTCFMFFTNRQKPELISSIYLNVIIKQENSVRFLGIILDNKLKFNLHIDHICNKVSKSIGIFHKLKNVTNKKNVTSLYYSLVYPYLSSGMG